MNKYKFDQYFVMKCFDMFLVRRTTRRIGSKKPVIINKKQPNGINVTIRRTLGQDIDASCGQLRKKYNDSLKTQ